MCGAGESSKEAAMKEIKPPNLALEKIRSVIRKVRLEVDEEKYFLAQKYFSPSVQWLVMCGDLARSRPRDHGQWWSSSGGAWQQQSAPSCPQSHNRLAVRTILTVM